MKRRLSQPISTVEFLIRVVLDVWAGENANELAIVKGRKRDTI